MISSFHLTLLFFIHLDCPPQWGSRRQSPSHQPPADGNNEHLLAGPLVGGWTIWWWEMEKVRCPSLLSPLLARSYCQGDGLKGWSEHSIVQENGLFIDNKIKQTNKQKLHHRGKQAGNQAWQGWKLISKNTHKPCVHTRYDNMNTHSWKKHELRATTQHTWTEEWNSRPHAHTMRQHMEGECLNTPTWTRNSLHERRDPNTTLQHTQTRERTARAHLKLRTHIKTGHDGSVRALSQNHE